MKEEYHGEEIKGIPGYYINMETHEVWSSKIVVSHGVKKGVQWFKQKPKERHGYWYYNVIKNGKKTMISYNKVLACMKNHVSYNLAQYEDDDPDEYHGLPIPGLPNYYVDEEKHEAWSYLYQATYKRKVWKKKSLRRIRKLDYFYAEINKERRLASFNRSVFCAKHNIDFFDERLNKYYYANVGGECKPVDIGESISESWKRRRNRIAFERLPRTRHCIYTLQLLERAYMGETGPMLEYVEGKKRSYMEILMNGAAKLSKLNAKLGYEFALGALLKELKYGGSRIIDFDGWFIATAQGLVKREVLNSGKCLSIDYMRRLA